MRPLFFFLFFLAALSAAAQLSVKRGVTLMGSRWDITIVAPDSAEANRRIDEVIAEVTRIEYLISDWKAETQISEVNRQAGMAPVKVDREVLDLTLRALDISRRTGGAFDISFAAMERIWKFDGSMTRLPGPEAVRQARQYVDYRNIIVDTAQSTIFLKYPGMKIGFGALGEGYAADRCRDLMKARGVEAGIINGSGDMGAWGRQPDGSPWNIGITDPFHRGRISAIIPLEEGSVTTSGSYEKFAEINGKRYAHIINPATGYPATGLISVTVLGPSTEQCNAFSTSIMVLGRKAGMKLLKAYPGYRCLIVTDRNRIYTSKGFRLRKYRYRS